MALACMQVFDDEYCNLDMFTMNNFYFSKHCKFQIFHNLKSMQKLWTGGLGRADAGLAIAAFGRTV